MTYEATEYQQLKDRMEGKTIREVYEFAKDIPINNGGLRLIIEKIIEDIERLHAGNGEQ